MPNKRILTSPPVPRNPSLRRKAARTQNHGSNVVDDEAEARLLGAGRWASEAYDGEPASSCLEALLGDGRRHLQPAVAARMLVSTVSRSERLYSLFHEGQVAWIDATEASHRRSDLREWLQPPSTHRRVGGRTLWMLHRRRDL